MKSYQEPSDQKFAKDLIAGAPQEAKAFLAFKAQAERSDGQIPEKYRELISIAVALTTQCPYCIEVHVLNAKKIGITPGEIAEVTMIASALKAGAAVGHGLLAMKIYQGE